MIMNGENKYMKWERKLISRPTHWQTVLYAHSSNCVSTSIKSDNDQYFDVMHSSICDSCYSKWQTYGFQHSVVSHRGSHCSHQQLQQEAYFCSVKKKCTLPAQHPAGGRQCTLLDNQPIQPFTVAATYFPQELVETKPRAERSPTLTTLPETRLNANVHKLMRKSSKHHIEIYVDSINTMIGKMNI